MAAVHTPAGYELACFLAISHPAEVEHFHRPKIIRIRDRMHESAFPAQNAFA